MTQEALKLALEALELCNGAETVDGVVIYTDKAITAIKEALANRGESKPITVTSERGNEAYVRITMQVGNKYIQQCIPRNKFLKEDDVWWFMTKYAEQCIEKLKRFK